MNISALQPTSLITTLTVPCVPLHIYPLDRLTLRYRMHPHYFSLSAALVSRFLLRLQSAHLQAVGSTTSIQLASMHLSNSRISQRIIGSLGAPVAVSNYLMPEEELEESSGRHIDAEEATVQILRE